jgi:hypothetical protein
VVLVRDYITRNHEFAQESDAHQLELFFRCTVLADTLPANGPHPGVGGQMGVEWLDLTGPEAARLYPRVLQRRLLEPGPGPIYLGDVN